MNSTIKVKMKYAGCVTFDSVMHMMPSPIKGNNVSKKASRICHDGVHTTNQSTEKLWLSSTWCVLRAQGAVARSSSKSQRFKTRTWPHSS